MVLRCQGSEDDKDVVSVIQKLQEGHCRQRNRCAAGGRHGKAGVLRKQRLAHSGCSAVLESRVCLENDSGRFLEDGLGMDSKGPPVDSGDSQRLLRRKVSRSVLWTVPFAGP